MANSLELDDDQAMEDGPALGPSTADVYDPADDVSGGHYRGRVGAEGVAAVAGQFAHLHALPCPPERSLCRRHHSDMQGGVQVYHPAMHQSAWSRPVCLVEAVRSDWPGACSRREAPMQALLHGSRTDVAEIGLG